MQSAQYSFVPARMTRTRSKLRNICALLIRWTNLKQGRACVSGRSHFSRGLLKPGCDRSLLPAGSAIEE